MSTPSSTESESEEQRLHYQRALAQTVSDDQFNAGSIKELTKTLSDDDLTPQRSDDSLQKLLLETLDDSELGDKFVDFYSQPEQLFDSEGETDQEDWDNDSEVTSITESEAAERLDASGVPGRYQIEKLLGRGATGQVYAVKDNNLDRILAVKFMHPKDIHHPEKNARFIDEAITTARLDHPNILPLHDLDYTDGAVPFFSMRLADGQTLEECIQRPQNIFKGGTLDIIFKKVDIIIKVCDAISYAHKKGIVHNDIKPGNIMIGEYGDVLLVDWGTSTTPEQRTDPDQKILGTPMYMSPEQARKECSDELSDIYCIGSTLLHLILERFPIYSDDADSFWKLKNDGWYQNFSKEERQKVPPRLTAIIEHCLKAERSERYQSIEHLLGDLRAFRKGDAVSVYQDPIPEQVLRIVRKNKQTISIFAISLAFLLGIGYFIYLEKMKERSQWKPVLETSFELNTQTDFSKDWKLITFPTWRPDSYSEENLASSEHFEYKNGAILCGIGNFHGPLNLVSNIHTAGNLKVNWEFTSGENPANFNMFIGGNHRYNAYLFHLGGFGSDQIRLTKYASVQTLDVHTLETPFQPFTTYNFTAIKTGTNVQLYMGDRLIIDYVDPIPYVGPQHEQFGFEAIYNNEYTINSVKAWNKPLPQKISPIIIADDYFSHGHFQLALETYDDIRENYNDTSMAPIALFRSAQCLIELDKSVNALIRLREFIKRYPNHEYIIYAHTNICFIHLDNEDWPDLEKQMAEISKGYKGHRILRWLHQRATDALIDRYALYQPYGRMNKPFQRIDAAYKHAEHYDNLLGNLSSKHNKLHKRIVSILRSLGRDDLELKYYGDFNISIETLLKLGKLDQATRIAPENIHVIRAHMLNGNLDYVKPYLDRTNMNWGILLSENDTIQNYLETNAPESHPIHKVLARIRAPKLSTEELLKQNPYDFDTLVSSRQYQKALEVYQQGRAKDVHIWKYGQLLSLAGQEDKVINSDLFSTITKAKAYSSKGMRLWLADKQDQALQTYKELQEYLGHSSGDLTSYYIFPVVLEWSIHQDKARLRKDLYALAERFSGRYQNRHLHLVQWLLGELSDEAYQNKIYNRYKTKSADELKLGLRADLMGKHQEALTYYRESSYVFDSDLQLFTKWRIQTLEQLSND